MNKELKSIEAAVAIVIVISIFILIFNTPSEAPYKAGTGEASESMLPEPSAGAGDAELAGQAGKESMETYSNPSFNLTFQYPSSLALKSTLSGNSNDPVLTVDLTKKFRASVGASGINILETGADSSKITVRSEFDLQGLSGEELVQAEATWADAKTQISAFQIGDVMAYAYGWENAKQGRTVVIPDSGRVHVYSVSWNDPEDQIVKDFDMILLSISM